LLVGSLSNVLVVSVAVLALKISAFRPGSTAPVIVITPLAPGAMSAIFQRYGAPGSVLIAGPPLVTLKLCSAAGNVSVSSTPLAIATPPFW
jgi:hypothetical protein